MIYTISLYLALGIFILGSVYRVAQWFSLKIGPEAETVTARARMWGAVTGLLRVPFRSRLFSAAKTFLLEVVLQVHLLKKDFRRWVMHFSLFAGFLLLFLMHGLDGQITATLFPDYYPTAAPFLFLRNFFGAMVLFGIAVAIYRRAASKGLKRLTGSRDVLALVLLAVIMGSGFLLEAVKIQSEPIFNEMVEDYAGLEDPEEIRALGAYWSKYYGVVFSAGPLASDSGLLDKGGELHLENCAGCHARPTQAFISYPLSRMFKAAAVWAGVVRLDKVLWHIHYLSCFLLLAWLPFGKFVHIFGSSISLIVRGLENRESFRPAGQLTRRALSFDACMNCGACSLHCSVEPVYRLMGNPDVLPSHKLASLNIFANRRMTEQDALARFGEGSSICTSCNRCTQICPAGIDLQDLWLASKEDLAARGLSGPYQLVRTDRKSARKAKTVAASSTPEADVTFNGLGFSRDPASFAACIQCGVCTNVCPVVANYQEAPREMGSLDLTPQQIVNGFRLGLTDRIAASKMAWDCFMCFKCQENCPRGIPIAEMIYELRNRGYREAAL